MRYFCRTPHVQTRWATPNGKMPSLSEAGHLVQPDHPSTIQLLEYMARQSLARGHWRVALRRILMAQVAGGELTADLDDALRIHGIRLSGPEMRHMQDAAVRWFQMISCPLLRIPDESLQ